ncbi:hypothetical protein JNUCC1_03008 [Lentibacillus sp. JNUCC-1]|uniref:DUF1836 domain-containing protein n=1 Tax=Lentibacillus sp. JNUCC-1 TaxID=2654513 RepID=UPI0012E97155|nr:DUF1836 domain-containing protein [Lentibacillus sp. JNUCC-1]MUV39135.1 hypothetical protein [Lentibacillus sp. JNUCC-1]
MRKWETLIDELQLENRLALEDIPDVDLYMDQVIQLFEKKFASSKRNEDEKVLTKTMINNYAKGQLFIPIKNKRYTKNHIMLISMIYQLKGALSIKDIKQLLYQLNDKITDDDFQLEDLYEGYLELAKENADHFKEDVMTRAEDVVDELDALKEDDDVEYLERLLMAASFVNMSNLYRRAAEKLVDDMDMPQEKQK